MPTVVKTVIMYVSFWDTYMKYPDTFWFIYLYSVKLSMLLMILN